MKNKKKFDKIIEQIVLKVNKIFMGENLKRHRELSRIKRILNLIEKIWKKNPDLRLYQLLRNCFDIPPDVDLYYVEDDELEERLRKNYEIEEIK